MLARLPLASHGLAIHSTSKLLLTRTSLFFILSVQTVSISQQLCICSTELGSACVLANKNRQETLRLTPVCRVKGHQAGPMSATGRNLPTAAWRLKGFSNMRDLVVPFDALILYFHLEEPPPPPPPPSPAHQHHPAPRYYKEHVYCVHSVKNRSLPIDTEPYH